MAVRPRAARSPKAQEYGGAFERRKTDHSIVTKGSLVNEWPLHSAEGGEEGQFSFRQGQIWW